jgi:hypothetical protein
MVNIVKFPYLLLKPYGDHEAWKEGKEGSKT